jgi:DNA-binding protein HU-beta
MKKKDAEAMVDAFEHTVKDSLKRGEKVTLIGFGTWATIERREKELTQGLAIRS